MKPPAPKATDTDAPAPPPGRKIALNTLLLSATEFTTRLISLVLIILVARRLGPALLGIYAFALGLVRLVELVLNYGLDRYLQREVGRRPETAGLFASRLLALKSLLYLACLVVLVPVVLAVLEEPLKRQVVLLLLLALFFRVHTASLTSLFRARQQASLEAGVVITLRLCYGGGGVAAILAGYGLLTLALLEAASQAAALAMALWLFRRRLGSPWHKVTLAPLGELLSAGTRFFLIRLVLTLSGSLHLLLLSVLAGDLATGLYAAALRLTSAFDFLPEAFTGAFLPVLSREGQSRRQDFFTIFHQYCKYLSMVGLGLAACLAGAAPALMPLIFGAAFVPAVPVLMILALGLALEFLNLALSNTLIAVNREDLVLKIFALVSIGSVMANLWLVPLFGEQGAAWAAALGEALALFCLMLALTREGLSPGRVVLRLWGALGAALAALAGGWLLAWFGAPWPLALSTPPLIFLLGLLATGAVGRTEFQTLKTWAAEGRYVS